MHKIPCALVLALAKAGNSNPARIAMIAMTTNNSISVKPWRRMVSDDQRLFDFGVAIELNTFLSKPHERFGRCAESKLPGLFSQLCVLVHICQDRVTQGNASSSIVVHLRFFFSSFSLNCRV